MGYVKCWKHYIVYISIIINCLPYSAPAQCSLSSEDFYDFSAHLVTICLRCISNQWMKSLISMYSVLHICLIMCSVKTNHTQDMKASVTLSFILKISRLYTVSVWMCIFCDWTEHSLGRCQSSSSVSNVLVAAFCLKSGGVLLHTKPWHVTPSLWSRAGPSLGQVRCQKKLSALPWPLFLSDLQDGISHRVRVLSCFAEYVISLEYPLRAMPDSVAWFVRRAV